MKSNQKTLFLEIEGCLFYMGKEGACKIKKAPLMIKPSKPPQGARGKPYNRPSPVGNAPLLPPMAASSPEGQIYRRLPVETCGTFHSTHSPTASHRGEGGAVRHQRGGGSCRRQLFSVFPSRQRRGCMVLSKEAAALFKRPPTAGPKGPSDVWSEV